MPILPVQEEMLKPKERRYVKVEAPVLDEISGLGIIKLLKLNTYDTLSMQIKFERNMTFLEVTNDSSQVIDLDPKRVVAVSEEVSIVFRH